MSSSSFALFAFTAFAGSVVGIVFYLRAANKLMTLSATAPNLTVPQRRQSPRRRVRKRAVIVFEQGVYRVRCRILNLSDSGALLIPIDTTPLPKEFVLKPFIGKERNCEVVWRKATAFGVRFLGTPPVGKVAFQN
jgi:PilZ domain